MSEGLTREQYHGLWQAALADKKILRAERNEARRLVVTLSKACLAALEPAGDTEAEVKAQLLVAYLSAGAYLYGGESDGTAPATGGEAR